MFLPWERGDRVLRRLGPSRVRPFALFVAVIVFVAFLGSRERHRAGVRATRATILVARRALDNFRADQNGECPKGGFPEVVSRGYLPQVPNDAWGRPLHLACPSRHPNRDYDLYSDGPDGEPGGLDRVE